MQSTATISAAKIGNPITTSYNKPPHSTLSLTLDIDLPSPSAIKSIEDWADEWNTTGSRKLREYRAKAQRAAAAKAKREEKKKPKDAPKPADADEDDDPNDDDAEDYDDNGYNRRRAELTDDERAHIAKDYAEFVAAANEQNQAALRGAMEAGFFLLLIKQQVTVSITPTQQGFADLLQLQSPS